MLTAMAVVVKITMVDCELVNSRCLVEAEILKSSNSRSDIRSVEQYVYRTIKHLA